MTRSIRDMKTRDHECVQIFQVIMFMLIRKVEIWG